jgi:hypothetical protein
MRTFVAAYPREPIVRRIAHAENRATRAENRATVPLGVCRSARPRERHASCRRLTRAGPDDDPHPERACEVCGASLAGKRRHAKTCSTRCRVARHRGLKPDPELLRRWEGALPRFKLLAPDDRLTILAAVVWPDELPELAGRLLEAA